MEGQSAADLFARLSSYNDEVVQRERAEWERTRALAVRVTNILMPRGKKIKKVEDYWPLPWDEKIETLKVQGTEEEIQRSLKLLIEKSKK